MAPAASVSVTATVDTPPAVGVPEITPVVALIVSPAGSPVADQLYAVVPPDPVIVVLYADSDAAVGQRRSRGDRRCAALIVSGVLPRRGRVAERVVECDRRGRSTAPRSGCR